MSQEFTKKMQDVANTRLMFQTIQKLREVVLTFRELGVSPETLSWFGLGSERLMKECKDAIAVLEKSAFDEIVKKNFNG